MPAAFSLLVVAGSSTSWREHQQNERFERGPGRQGNPRPGKARQGKAIGKRATEEKQTPSRLWLLCVTRPQEVKRQKPPKFYSQKFTKYNNNNNNKNSKQDLVGSVPTLHPSQRQATTKCKNVPRNLRNIIIIHEMRNNSAGLSRKH